MVVSKSSNCFKKILSIMNIGDGDGPGQTSAKDKELQDKEIEM